MQIVKVTQDNYPLFSDMVYARVHGQPRPPAQRGLLRPEDAGSLRALDDSHLSVYAAVLKGEMVGWISLIYMPKLSRWQGAGALYVDELYIAPAHRRQGIARQLMARAEERARELGAACLRLYVNLQNPGAQALYASLDYQRQGEAVFMEKPMGG